MDPLHRSSKDKSALPAGTPLDVSQPSDLVERAYRVVVEMLYESGVRGVADLKTAQIAKRLRSTESTLFRHIESREHLIANSINWCWEQMNHTLAQSVFDKPGRDTNSTQAVVEDLETVLQMFDDPILRVWGTGALLSFRRPDQMIGDFRIPERERFLDRLSGLIASAFHCEAPNDDTAAAAVFLTNAVATAWFTWLFDPSTSEDDALLSRTFVLHGIEGHLSRLSISCTRAP
jgi:AcrR family transcriptional regulator